MAVVGSSMSATASLAGPPLLKDIAHKTSDPLLFQGRASSKISMSVFPVFFTVKINCGPVKASRTISAETEIASSVGNGDAPFTVRVKASPTSQIAGLNFMMNFSDRPPARRGVGRPRDSQAGPDNHLT